MILVPVKNTMAVGGGRALKLSLSTDTSLAAIHNKLINISKGFRAVEEQKLDISY
jgi:hypothetical protein